MKKRIYKGLAMCVTLVLMSMSMLGCGEFLDDEEYYMDESYSDDAQNDDADSDLAYTGDVNLLDDSQFPLGSCRKAEGKLVLVSIFADDASSSWDFENNENDLQIYQNMVRQTRIGCDWLEQQAQNYGKNFEIISDFEADEELFYQAKLDAQFDDNEYHIEEVKGFIRDSLGGLGEHLLEKYDADNICYAFYFNKSADSQMSSCAYPYLGPENMDMPYECTLYSAHVYGEEQGPAMYAHEILHCFGAPDLYFENASIEPIYISQEFSDYCRENHLNEIMFSNYDVENQCIDNERVTNELTDMTAYYLGWVDYDEECEQFGALVREDK